jgi:O-methyltransferase
MELLRSGTMLFRMAKKGLIVQVGFANMLLEANTSCHPPRLLKCLPECRSNPLADVATWGSVGGWDTCKELIPVQITPRFLIDKTLGKFGVRLVKIKSPIWSNPTSPEILHSKVYPVASYSPWLSDFEFQETYELMKHNTLVDLYRCFELWQLAKQAASIPGPIIEVGVWRGGTGCLLAKAAPEKLVYLADTFTGVVKAGEQDTQYVGGEHSDTSEEIVRLLIERTGATNTKILKGIFPDDTASVIEDAKISLLHIDVDVYQSGKGVVEWAIPRLSIGSVIVFDDYGFTNCEGITRLAQELAALPMFSMVHNLNGHAILTKIK